MWIDTVLKGMFADMGDQPRQELVFFRDDALIPVQGELLLRLWPGLAAGTGQDPPEQ